MNVNEKMSFALVLVHYLANASGPPANDFRRVFAIRILKCHCEQVEFLDDKTEQSS